jgi:hypothetical protein
MLRLTRRLEAVSASPATVAVTNNGRRPTGFAGPATPNAEYLVPVIEVLRRSSKRRGIPGQWRAGTRTGLKCW